MKPRSKVAGLAASLVALGFLGAAPLAAADKPKFKSYQHRGDSQHYSGRHRDACPRGMHRHHGACYPHRDRHADRYAPPRRYGHRGYLHRFDRDYVQRDYGRYGHRRGYRHRDYWLHDFGRFGIYLDLGDRYYPRRHRHDRYCRH